MGRYAVSGRMTIAPTALRPGVSLFAVANVRLNVREVGVFNTTTTGLMIALIRMTAADDVGSGLTEAKSGDADIPAAQGTGFAGHTGDSAGIGEEIRRASLGAAIGAGVIWTFDDEPLRIPPGTANGIGLYTPTGTGQICDYYIDWEE